MSKRLAEGLTYEWRAERHIETLLGGLAKGDVPPETAARLAELSASARARRNRLERRLHAIATGPRLAPVPPLIERTDEALEVALALTRAAADRYNALAELSRRLSDPETAFACELNRIAAEEAGILLDGLLALEVDRRAGRAEG